MTDVITTRRLEEADVEPVLELLRAALGEPPLLKRTPSLFSWKHFDNPFGHSIGLIAESGDEIVGLRTFMRWDLKAPDGGTIRCVRAVDTATHPDFERRGIFRRLTEEAIEVATDDGVDLIFNTPNAKSGSGYLKMGWQEVGQIGALVRPTSRMLSRDETALGDTGFDPVDPTRLTDRPARGLRTPRSEAYLRWRFTAHPTARYFESRVGEGVAVLRNNIRGGRQELLVADLYGPGSSRAISAARRRSRAMYLGSWFSVGSPERAECRRAGLLPVPGVTTLTLMARRLSDFDVDISSMSSWDLALSDLELL